MTEERTHISDEMWKKYAQGTLSTKEEEKLYTHVGCCTYCAERFANIVETDFFAEPPSYLYDEIVERSRHPISTTRLSSGAGRWMFRRQQQ